MVYKNEKQLLIIIKYTLPLFLLIISIVINTFLYYKNQIDFEKSIQVIEKEFIENKKKFIKEQIDSLYDYVISEQKETEENLRKSLKNETYKVHKIILSIYNKYKDTHTQEEITDIIKTVVRPIKFNNGRGYFFIVDKNRVSILNALFPEVEGKYKKGVYTNRKDPVKVLKVKKEFFDEWYWRKSKDDLKEYKKFGFIKDLSPLNWFIGTGEYVESFEEDIQKEVLKQIEKLKFGTNSYFLVADKNNNYISHINKDLIGKNLYEILENINAISSLKEIKKTIKEKKGFVQLDFFKPNNNTPTSKTMYLRTIPKWGWVISTGFYQEDINKMIMKEKIRLENNNNQNLQNQMIITIFSSIILLIISFYIVTLIEKKFKQYKIDIKHHTNKNRQQSKILYQQNKMAAMGEMIANIAHQWRQPLSTISTASTGARLQKEMNCLSDIELDATLVTINNSAQYLSQTIDDFRGFFNPKNSILNEFKIEDTLIKTLNLVDSEFDAKDIEIITNIQNYQLLSVENDIIQVLINILNNAKDALITKEKVRRLIFINTYKTKNISYIEIIDNAGGIENNIIDRIFEPYFTTKDKLQGTGIGLYMSVGIVRNHLKGTLTVTNTSYEFEDVEYHGAKFTITLG